MRDNEVEEKKGQWEEIQRWRQVCVLVTRETRKDGRKREKKI